MNNVLFSINIIMYNKCINNIKHTAQCVEGCMIRYRGCQRCYCYNSFPQNPQGNWIIAESTCPNDERYLCMQCYPGRTLTWDPWSRVNRCPLCMIYFYA